MLYVLLNVQNVGDYHYWRWSVNINIRSKLTVEIGIKHMISY